MATSLSRVEDILQTKIDGTSYDEPPQSRVEELLIELNTGGGGGGTSNYNQLSNRPKIGGKTVSGTQSIDYYGGQPIVLASTLSIGGQTITQVEPALQALNSSKQGTLTFDNEPTSGSSNPVKSGGVYSALSEKVDALDLADVAFSGSYDDLLNTPTIPDPITVDSELSNSSENPVQNKVIYSALADKVNTSSVGTASGIAELDANGKVPSSQLPSYVDDVIDGYYKDADGKFYEESTYETEIPGEDGKIYISNDTDVQYRWTGSAFSPLGGALVLGETSTTAYRGDRGKAAYDDSQTNKTAIGTLSNLTTTSKSNLVEAINELNANKAEAYTAGDGIDINNSEISVDPMPSADMSEIVTPLPGVQSRRMTYSTEEQVVGTWIDGKPIYQKTVDCGALPNATSKNVAHGISNLKRVVDIKSVSHRTDSDTFTPVPKVADQSINNQCAIYVDATNITLEGRNGNASVYDDTYVTLQYTKTTD